MDETAIKSIKIPDDDHIDVYKRQVFPHHENEIAQSEAATGKPFAHYWMHNGHINIDNKKMSKSAGNFFLTKDAAAKYGYETIRYLMKMCIRDSRMLS